MRLVPALLPFVLLLERTSLDSAVRLGQRFRLPGAMKTAQVFLAMFGCLNPLGKQKKRCFFSGKTLKTAGF